MYVLNVQQKKKDLVDEVRELREKVAELEANKSVSVNTTVQVNNSDLEEAKAQRDYWEKKCRRYGKYIEQVIEVTYNRIKPMLWSKLEEKSEFREHILEEVREICGNDE